MIIYFSGTGNSRYCADFLAEHTKQQAINAFDMMKSHSSLTLSSAEPWVFVSPTYAWRLPRIFVDFLKSTRISGSRDAYFVMTCGTDIGAAPSENENLCRELGLCCKGTFAVRMPENYIAMFRAPNKSETLAIIGKAQPVLEKISETILTCRDDSSFRPSLTDKIKSGPINSLFYPLFVNDRKFTVSDACIGCGQCAAVCVMDNIRLCDHRPVWGGQCTQCMACICSCPAEAIEYGKRSIGQPRYLCPPYRP